MLKPWFTIQNDISPFCARSWLLLINIRGHSYRINFVITNHYTVRYIAMHRNIIIGVDIFFPVCLICFFPNQPGFEIFSEFGKHGAIWKKTVQKVSEPDYSSSQAYWDCNGTRKIILHSFFTQPDSLTANHFSFIWNEDWSKNQKRASVNYQNQVISLPFTSSSSHALLNLN